MLTDAPDPMLVTWALIVSHEYKTRYVIGLPYQSKYNKDIINIDPPPQCTLRDEPSDNRQSGSDE